MTIFNKTEEIEGIKLTKDDFEISKGHGDGNTPPFIVIKCGWDMEPQAMELQKQILQWKEEAAYWNKFIRGYAVDDIRLEEIDKLAKWNAELQTKLNQLEDLNKLNLEHWKELGHEKYLLEQKLDHRESQLKEIDPAKVTLEKVKKLSNQYADEAHIMAKDLKKILEEKS